MKIAARQPIDVEASRLVATGAEIVSVETDEELLREARNAEIVVGIGPSVFEELVGSSKTLRWVHTSVAGADRFVPPALAAGRIVLTCAKGGPAGRNLAEISAGFGTKIIATKRAGPYSETDRLRVLPPTGFDELLRGSTVDTDALVEAPTGRPSPLVDAERNRISPHRRSLAHSAHSQRRALPRERRSIRGERTARQRRGPERGVLIRQTVQPGKGGLVLHDNYPGGRVRLPRSTGNRLRYVAGPARRDEPESVGDR